MLFNFCGSEDAVIDTDFIEHSSHSEILILVVVRADFEERLRRVKDVPLLCTRLVLQPAVDVQSHLLSIVGAHHVVPLALLQSSFCF